jgi:hypothetical protein
MLDPMPRKDVKLPPTPREADLMAEIERLRGVLSRVVKIYDNRVCVKWAARKMRDACFSAIKLNEGD